MSPRLILAMWVWSVVTIANALTCKRSHDAFNKFDDAYDKRPRFEWNSEHGLWDLKEECN